MTLKDILISGKITVSGGTAPTGEIEITENGTYDVTDYASAEVNVGGGSDWRKKDGKTHLHITIDQNVFKTVNLRFGQTVASGNTIDWGDGTAPVTPTNTSSAYITHTYNALGDYVITIENTSGYFYFGESSTTKGFIFQDGVNNISNEKVRNYTTILKKAEIGKGWQADVARQFAMCKCLNEVYISVKPDQTSIGGYMFDTCTALAVIDGVDGWDAGITTLGNYMLSYCISLQKPFVPANVTKIPDYYLQGNTSVPTAITAIILPSGITSIGKNAFTQCKYAAIIDIPATVTTIGNDAFQYPYGAHEIHVRATTPPTLGNGSVFNGFGTNVYNPKIYVPAASLSDYQSANNWSGLASYMEGE